MSYEIKNIEGGILDVDDKSRRVKVALNKTGVKDFDNDVIDVLAYDKTISERGPKGKNLIWHLTDHFPSLKNAVGKFKELKIEGEHLVGITDVPNTTWGNDVLEFYKSGTINQHSIGFSTIKREIFHEDDPTKRYTLLKEIKLYEGSAVLWGANEHTPTLSVGKSLDKEELKTEFDQALVELTKLYKMFKSGHLSDQSFELIEMKMNQITDKLQHLFTFTTQPAVKAVEPETMNDVFNNFINTLKRQDNDERRTASTA